MANQVGVLRDLAQAIDAAFAQFIAVMADLRGRLAEMDAGLARLLQVLAGQREGVQALDLIEAAVTDLAAALDGATDAALPPRVAAAVETARAALDEIGVRTRMLDAVANLTLVTAQSLNVPGFHDYVATLRELSASVGRTVGRLDAVVLALRARRVAAGALLGTAQGRLAGVAARMADLHGQQAASARLVAHSRQQAADQALRLPAVAAHETDTLVRAMQFADAVAQRLDHLGTILAHESGAGARALARAQAEALVADAGRVAQDVTASIAAIRAAAGDAARLLAADGGAEAEGLAQGLELGRRMLDRLLAEAGVAMDAISQAAAEVSPLQALAADAVAEFAGVDQATAMIRLAAFNAALLSLAGGAGREAMNVLSVEVRDQAQACAVAAGRCSAAIASLSQAQDMAAFAGVGARMEALRQAIDRTATALEGATAAGAEVAALRRTTVEGLHHLDQAGAVALDAVARIRAATEGLVALAATWPRQAPPGVGDLAALMPIYTMEAERVVHRRLFGLPEEVPPPPLAATGTADPLAAILF